MIDEVLKERGDRYGDFGDHADIAQGFKKIMMNSRSWMDLTPSMKQTMEMFADKMARILNGDPFYDDSWIDIIGYSQLIVNQLHQKDTDEDAEEGINSVEELVNNYDFDTDDEGWTIPVGYNLLRDEETKEIPYPKLMKSENGKTLLAMTEDGVGTVVFSEEMYTVGFKSINWYMPSLFDI